MRSVKKTNSAALIERCQKDPVFQIREVQGCTTLEPFQETIAKAIRQFERVAVSACHDVGKTFTSAKIVLWFLSSFPGAKVITTAPTFELVEKLLWTEIRSGHRLSKYPLGGRMLNTEWKIRDDWFAVGLSPKEESDGEGGQGKGSSFQGFHAEYLLVVFDEATGVPPKRWIQAEGMMTSGFVRWLAIGNPTSSTSQFAKCFKSRKWHRIYLSCFDSPNLKANGITDIEKLRAELDLIRAMPEKEADQRIASYKVVHNKLLTLKWVVDAALEWGIDHPLFVSKVLGRFPENDDHVLMPLGAVERAQIREQSASASDRYCIGVDVARFGSDKTILTMLHGFAFKGNKALIGKDTAAVSGEVIHQLGLALSDNVRPDKIVICIDGTGVGGGVVDNLKEAQREKRIPQAVEIREVNFGEGFKYIKDDVRRAELEKLYSNRKAKLFVQLSLDLRENLALGEDSAYLEELPTIQYKFDSKGRYVIESKEEYKKRTGRPSPDHADSLALANEGRYEAELSGSFTSEAKTSRRAIVSSLNRGDQW